MEININKPLKSKYKLDNQVYHHMRAFTWCVLECGCYGHNAEKFPNSNSNTTNANNEASVVKTNVDPQEEEGSKFGP